MDLLQLTVLALNLAKKHSTSAVTTFQVHFPPIWFDCLSFCVFHFDDFHLSSRRVGSDKLVSACDGGICIFIPLNKREMRSGALRLLLCDRNHIIDWHTESCPSNSPRRARTAFWWKQRQVGGRRGLWANSLSLPRFSRSLCLPRSSQSFTAPTRNNGERGSWRGIPSGRIIPGFRLQQMSFVFPWTVASCEALTCNPIVPNMHPGFCVSDVGRIYA